MQETPLAAEAVTPDSTSWKTPDATPSQAWERKEETLLQEEEIASDDDVMDKDGATFEYPVILVTKEEKERLRRPWRRSLIFRIMGRTVSYSYLLQRLQKMWKPEAPFELIALTHDYFIAKFEALRDYEFAKYEGPWMILDHYVIVQEWQPNFDPRSNKTEKLLVWARFPSLPIEYFEEEFLMKIGKQIGRPIKIDYTTSLISKGKFARMCIEVDITKPLLSKFVLDFKEWPIEYEGIHLVCFKCGIYGHRQEQCGKDGKGGDTDHAKYGASTSAKSPVANYQKLPTEKYGSWMLVSRKPRWNNSRNTNWSAAGQQRPMQHVSPREKETMVGDQRSQSRFAVLDGLDKNGMDQYQEGQTTPIEIQQSHGALPRIRTNYRGGHHQQDQRRSDPPPRTRNQLDLIRQSQLAGRGGFRGRGGRGGGPNRAAAELEHTVVRGSNKGKNISSMVVYHSNDYSSSPSLADFENTYKNDPPDTVRRFLNIDEPPGEAMQEAERVFDPVDQMVDNRQRF